MNWLLESETLANIDAAHRAGLSPTAAQQVSFSARADLRVLSVAGETAEIAVKGVLTKSPDIMSMLFGGGNTTYAEVISALAEADADPNVTSAVLAIDSPGGQFDGLFDLLAAEEAFSKPLTVRVDGVAASAAYAVASAGGRITAASYSARIGSIGVAASYFVSEDIIDITSTNAPKKRPDVTTAEGVATVREELDALHDLFAETIATGRGTTIERVNADFGQGGMLLAGEALKRGMIDSIATPTLQSVPKSTQQTAEAVGTERMMDAAKLKAEHPAVYSAVRDEGVTAERDRVTAHMTMGESSGDMKTAIAAIADGSEMTATLQAKYMAAGMNRASIAARAGDDNDIGDAGRDIDSTAAEDAANAAALVAAAEHSGVELEVKRA